MDNMWDTIKRNLQDGAAVAMSKAEELTQLGRARLDMAAIKTRCNRLQAELGELVYHRIESGQGEGLAESADLQAICDRIRGAEEELASCETAFQELKADLEDSGTEPAEPEAKGE